MRYIKLILLLILFANANAQDKIIHLDNIDPKNENFQDLQELQSVIGNAQVVLLGEPTHGEGNVFEAKTRLIKFLHQEMGFSTLAFESDFYDFNKIDQIMKADGNSYSDCLNSCISPIWTSTREFQELTKYMVNNKRNLKVIGFDNQFMSDYSAEVLFGDLFLLAKGLQIELNEKQLQFLNECINTISSTFDVPDNFKFGQFNSLVKRFNQKLDQHSDHKVINEHPVHFWKQILSNLKAVVTDYYSNHPGRKSQDEFKAKDSNVRDYRMAQNLLYYLKFHPHEKIICWGANAHFSNKFTNFNNAELDEYKPMGQHLKAELGDQKVFILGSTCATGTHGVYKVDTIPILNIESIEQQLVKDSVEYAIVPLRRDKAITCSAFEYKALKGNWGNTFDALLFFKQSNPPQQCTDPFTEDLDISEPSISTKEEVQNQTSKNIEEASKTSSYKSLELKNIDFTLKGIVCSEQNEAIPFVNIGVKGATLGTISNENGEFEIGINQDNLNDSLSFSCIGYAGQQFKISDLKREKKIRITLQSQEYLLSEVQIKQKRLTAKKVLRKTIKAIKNNYIQKAYQQEMLIRSISLFDVRSKPSIIESLNLYIDKDGYQRHPLYSLVEKEIIDDRGRRIASIDLAVNKVGKYHDLKGDVFMPSSRYLDKINFRKNSFLNTLKWFRYEFQLEDTLQYNQKTVFKINFKSKYPSHRSTLELAPIKYYGYLYINMDDYAIVKIESYSIINRYKVWRAKSSPAYSSKGVWFEKKVVFYKKQGNYYFLDYAAEFNNYSLFLNSCEKFGYKVHLGKYQKDKDTIEYQLDWDKCKLNPRYNQAYQFKTIKEL